jgi:putative membrane protein
MVRETPIWLLVAVVVLFLGAFFPLNFGESEGFSEISGAVTLLVALPSFAALWRYCGGPRAVLVLVGLALFAYAIEALGVATGLPYGEFSYSAGLGPKLAGLVPWLLPFSYIPLVLGAVAAVPPGRGRALRAAVVLVVMDLALDPGAVALGLWEWGEQGVYYSIPLSNYAGWLISGLLASALVLALGRWGKPPRPGLLDSAALLMAFWAGIAVFSVMMIPAVVGILVVLYLLYRRGRLRYKLPVRARAEGRV